jgi:predicted nucleic acid-binding Zn ribbon protein
MSDPPIESCETCGAGPVEKVLYPVAVHFKGSGFYSTDYGKGKRAAAGGKESEGATGEKTAAGGDSGEKKKDGGSDAGEKKKPSSTE